MSPGLTNSLKNKDILLFESNYSSKLQPITVLSPLSMEILSGSRLAIDS